MNLRNLALGGIVALLSGCNEKTSHENTKTPVVVENKVVKQDSKLDKNVERVEEQNSELEVKVLKDLSNLPATGAAAVIYNSTGKLTDPGYISYDKIIEKHPHMKIFKLLTGPEAKEIGQGKNFMLLYNDKKEIERIIDIESPGILEQEIYVHFGGEPKDGRIIVPFYSPVPGRHKCNLALKPGDPAPNFQTRTLDGKTVSLADLKGKVIYLEFGASDSDPSVKRISENKIIYEKLKDKEFRMFWVVTDANKNILEKFVKEEKIPYDVLCDEQGWGGFLFDKYEVPFVPYTYVIDRQGKIAERNITLSEKDIEKLLR